MYRRSVLTIFSVGILSVCLVQQTTTADFDNLKVRDEWIVDGDGRVRIFHGFNAVTKGIPWYPENLLNETRLQLYQDWGFNVVRLGTMWSGVYPQENKRNDTYISIMNKIIGNLASHGMYALLDMHQDGLTSLYGSYDGAPKWLIEKYPEPRKPYPWPFEKITFWMYNYLTDATGEAFQHLYNNASGSMDHWSQFWQTVAEQIGKPNNNIIGYELVNEPWPGDIYANPLLLLPGNAGSETLQRLYETLSAAIRKIDDETLIFFEPVTWGMLFNGEYTGSGLKHVPGGDAYRDRSVFSYHYYCWVKSSEIHKPYPILSRLACDKLLGPDVIRAVKKDIATFGGSSFLTEFGECAPDGNVNSTNTIECEFVLALTDSNFQSWTYWDSIFFDANGDPIMDTVRGFARAYAQAVSGIPQLMKFDPISAEFDLWYNLDTNITSATEIVVPSVQYPRGVEVQVSDGMISKYDAKSHLVLVTSASSTMKDQSLVKVNIKPK